MVRDRLRHPARGAVCFRSILFASFSSSLLSFGSSTRTNASESLCFVTRAPPTHVADHLTARYVPGLSPGDPSCCSPCEAYETAARWTNASVAAIWRVFDERRAETNPGAPAMLDVVDASKLESSTMCSQLIRQPECYALATAFLATLACAPGAANLERATRSVDPTKDEPPGSDDTANEPELDTSTSPTSRPSPPSPLPSTAHSARFDRREVRLCRSAADDVFAACESVELMGVTDVGAWFGQNPDDFVEIVAGGVKHTTPRLGDVRPVVVSSDSDEDEGACYESPRGADRDAWSKDGGWCCDEFPALGRCEGEIDYAEYGAVIDNAYAEALRRRGGFVTPSSLPWLIAALCFGWATFATFYLLTRDDTSSAPRGTSLSTMAQAEEARADVDASVRPGTSDDAHDAVATDANVAANARGKGADSGVPRKAGVFSGADADGGARRVGGWHRADARSVNKASARARAHSELAKRRGAEAEARDAAGVKSAPRLFTTVENEDERARDSARDSTTKAEEARDREDRDRDRDQDQDPPADPEERFLRSTDPLPRSVYGRLDQLTPLPGFPHAPPVVLSARHPKAYLFRNFLSPEECDHLVALANEKLAPSTVVGQSGPVASGIRTSAGMFLDKGQTPMLRGIEERIAAAVGLPEPNGEGMQILRYERGQKYDPHYDYFHDAANSSPKRGGQRMATMLIYLRDTEKGGETIFPKGTKPPDFDDPDAGAFEWSECASKTGVPVRSVRGDALLFWSLTEEYTLDAGSLHGACPVVAGEKWTAVKWIRVAKFDGGFSSPLPMPPLAVSDRKAADPKKACRDEWVECAEWARKGWCARNPEFMIGANGARDSKGPACPESCDVKCATA